MNFDISRLRRSDQIIGASAIFFFIFLFFFKWYGVSAGVTTIGGVNLGGTVSRSGWDTFTNSRWIWLITIIVALVAVAVASGALKFESPVQLSVVVTALGALSTLLILYRILHHPSASIPGFHAGIKIGIWLGLIAAAALTYGGYLGMQAEGTSLSDVRDQASQAISSATASGSSPSESSTSAAPPPSDASTAPSSPPPPASAEAPPIPPPVAPPSSDA